MIREIIRIFIWLFVKLCDICPIQKTNNTMNKTTKKRTYYNTEVLNILKGRHDCSLDFIRKSLRGDRVGEKSDVLRKEYNSFLKKTEEAINNEMRSLSNKIP